VIRWLDGNEVAGRLGYAEAAAALEAALAAGFDPDGEAPRGVMPAGEGQLLVMPSTAAGPIGVKLLTVGGEPRIQGICVLFDPATLAPSALLDGIALTTLRTAALSALAARRLVAGEPLRLLVFGRGPQGRAHAAALPDLLPSIAEVTIVGRSEEAPVEEADVICCCTDSPTPLFSGDRVGAEATVIAIGSHEPAAAELDPGLMRRAQVFVESRTSALREAGDVIGAGLGPDDLTPLAEPWVPEPGRPRVFKSTGMAWEDAVVGAAVIA
jgi:ornithine cyclodeaminase/alanine dehydrogenase-like protein (mu-crystallin family)